YFLLVILIIILIRSSLRNSTSTRKPRETFFRNADSPQRDRITLLLGALASFLALTSGNWTIGTVTWIFNVMLGLTIVLVVAVRPKDERQLNAFVWRLPVIIVQGFA